MNKVIFNPTNYTEQYLKYLNVCFPNWGDEQSFNWVYNRQVGQHKSDFIIITNEEDEVIAGSGITYRNIKTKEGLIRSVGVFTGSWTLPKARGRGCFTLIIEEFTKLCKDKNIDYLAAFVTESNASYRRFNSTGFKMLQADNFFSDLAFDYEPYGLVIEEIDLIKQEVYQMYKKVTQINSSYLYNYEEFVGQFLTRNTTVKGIRIEDNLVLFEENETTFRVLFYSKFNIKHLMALSHWVKKMRKKKVMFFLSNKSQIDICLDHNFIAVKSYFTYGKTSARELNMSNDFSSFSINLADKM